MTGREILIRKPLAVVNDTDNDCRVLREVAVVIAEKTTVSAAGWLGGSVW